MALSLGSDPEVGLKTTSGKIVTSIGRIGGTKNRPRQTMHGAIQEDGVSAEVNPIPAGSLSEFLENTQLVMEDLEDILRPLDLEVDISASKLFPQELLDSDQANIAGCEKDFNAWKKSVNPNVNLENTNLRAFGGHLHIGFDEAEHNILSRLEFVKALDMELAVPFVIFDDDRRRRSLYGKAGAHRPKFLKKDGYDGVEYRVLSNFWLTNIKYQRFIYDKVSSVNNDLATFAKKANENQEEIVYIINEGTSQHAIDFCHTYGVSYGL